MNTDKLTTVLGAVAGIGMVVSGAGNCEPLAPLVSVIPPDVAHVAVPVAGVATFLLGYFANKKSKNSSPVVPIDKPQE